MTGNIIQAKDISYTYPDGTRALRGLTLEVAAGEKTAVLGANGSGKTTLFLCLNGILKPQEGKIFISGEELSHRRQDLKKLRSRVGIVFQDPDTQLFFANVLQEIAFGPLNLGLKKEEVMRRVEKAMAITGITELRERATHLLSYGQKKRVAIADILAMEPEVLISDEPTAWLDQEHAAKIMDIFCRINSTGTTVIISTHDSDLAFSFADRVVILQHGIVLGAGRPEEVFLNDLFLAGAGLRKPLVLETYQKLCAGGYLQAGRPPRTREDLLAML